MVQVKGSHKVRYTAEQQWYNDLANLALYRRNRLLDRKFPMWLDFVGRWRDMLAVNDPETFLEVMLLEILMDECDEKGIRAALK